MPEMVIRGQPAHRLAGLRQVQHAPRRHPTHEDEHELLGQDEEAADPGGEAEVTLGVREDGEGQGVLEPQGELLQLMLRCEYSSHVFT